MDLTSAREQFELASFNLRTKASLKVDEQTKALWRAYHDAERQLLAAERLAAEVEARPFAKVWQVEVEWPRIALNAVLITGSFAAVLTFGGSAGILQVVFEHPNGVRFSCVSDEVISGHPLFGSGLSANGLFKVVNSEWIAELRTCDAVHPQHNEAYWNAVEHYVLCLKDRLCEVITTRKPTWRLFPARSEAIREAVALCEHEAPTDVIENEHGHFCAVKNNPSQDRLGPFS